MKLVAVSQRVDVVADRNERRDALDQRVGGWLAMAGYMPVPVPNGMNKALLRANDTDRLGLQRWLDAVRPEAVLLSGGNDLGECIERDETEQCLLAWAKDRKKPVLGICRGMQMMGVWAGAELKPIQGHVCTRHPLRGDLTGTVNSFHNFVLADCPKEFEVLAWGEDGAIEAIHHVCLPWEGWMWHPERETDFSTMDLQRLKKLFDH